MKNIDRQEVVTSLLGKYSVESLFDGSGKDIEHPDFKFGIRCWIEEDEDFDSIFRIYCFERLEYGTDIKSFMEIKIQRRMYIEVV